MTTFEYLAVLISVIVGLAMTHLLGGVSRLLSHPDRYKTEWIHLVWVAWAFCNLAFFWWHSFWMNTVEVWTAPLYTFMILTSVLLFIICSILMPSDFPDDGDFSRYFFSRRRLFFGLLIGSIFVNWVDSEIKDHPVPGLIGVGIALVVVTPGLFTENRKYHGAIALWSLFWGLFWLLAPGSAGMDQIGVF